MSNLIVLTYQDENTAMAALNSLQTMQKEHLIELADAAVATKDQKGKVKVKQTLENMNTGSAAIWGGLWGLLIGLLFLAPIFWAVFGALLGGIFGKFTDLGIDNKFIKQVGESLDPGNSALFMLVTQATPDKVIPELQKVGTAQVYQTSLSEEDEDKLRKALDHDPKIKDAANESLDLDEQPAATS